MTHDETVALAARIMGRRLALVESCIPWKATNQVLRCRVEDTGDTVIVKRSEEPDGPLMREWAALEFLAGIDGARELFPAVIAADREHEIVVLEDLGFPEEQQLGNILEGDDPVLAEAALLSQQRALGRMHAATVGRLDGFDRLLAEKGRVRNSRHNSNRLDEVVRELPGRLADAGAPAPIDDEIETVVATLTDPGPFLVLSHGDGTPANACFDGKKTRLFDLETAAPRHALVDGAYAPIRFLNSTWASRYPAPVAVRALAAYREELVRGCPAAADDDRFHGDLTRVAAAWLSSLLTLFPRVRDKDCEWRHATGRQIILAALDAFVALSEASGQLPATGDAALRAAESLRAAWPRDTWVLRLHGAWAGSGGAVN